MALGQHLQAAVALGCARVTPILQTPSAPPVWLAIISLAPAVLVSNLFFSEIVDQIQPILHGVCEACGCSTTGSQNTSCSSGDVCFCNTGFTGSLCSLCATGYYGSSCAGEPLPLFVCCCCFYNAKPFPFCWPFSLRLWCGSDFIRLQ